MTDPEVLEVLHTTRADLGRLSGQLEDVGHRLDRIAATLARLEQNRIKRRIAETAPAATRG